jgi:hypothetical protein
LLTACCHRLMDQFVAAQFGNLQHLHVALTVDNVNDVGGHGWTALHLAVNNGHHECVKYCIEMGANVRARTIDGRTYTLLHGRGVRMLFVYYWIRARWLTRQTVMYGHHFIGRFTTNALILRNYSWIEERKYQTSNWRTMNYQQSLIGSPRSLSRDPIVDLMGYTNTVEQQ